MNRHGITMSTTWVVDSNCFIHLGSMAQDNLLEDLRKSIPQGLYVTPGVHNEVRTVRFQRWKNKPNLLDKLKPILTTILSTFSRRVFKCELGFTIADRTWLSSLGKKEISVKSIFKLLGILKIKVENPGGLE